MKKIIHATGEIAGLIGDTTLTIVGESDHRGSYYVLYANSAVNDPDNALGAFNDLEEIREFLSAYQGEEE